MTSDRSCTRPSHNRHGVEAVRRNPQPPAGGPGASRRLLSVRSPREDAIVPATGTPLLVAAPNRLAPGVYILGSLKPSAAYVVGTSQGLVLIDSGLQDDARHLRSQMAKLGSTGAARACHLAHACPRRPLRRGPVPAGDDGGKVYAGAGDAGVLRAGGPREAFFSTFYMPDDSPHPTTVDVELRGGESIDFGDVRFRALAMPGHTPGSVCYLMEKAGLRACSPAM